VRPIADTGVARGVIFGPDESEPLLGVTALESVGITIDPANRTLKPLPALSLKQCTLQRRRDAFETIFDSLDGHDVAVERGMDHDTGIIPPREVRVQRLRIRAARQRGSR